MSETEILTRSGTRPTVALPAAAAVAWVAVVIIARRMDSMPGTMRLGLVAFAGVWALMMASDPDSVRCGISGYAHPGTEFFGDVLRSDDAPLRWAILGKHNAAFATDFDYRAG